MSWGGWPLVHIAQGVDSNTGLPRVARGIIALGNIAIGGWLAVGGIALALYLTAGGLAISTQYAVGGLALAPHSIGPMGADPEFVRLIERWWPGIRSAFPGAESQS